MSLSFSEKIRQILQDKRYRLTFVSAFLSGIISYAYLMLNNLNNYDNITCTPDGYGWGLGLGRWLLSLMADTVSRFWGNYNIPVFNCLLALFILSFCSCLLIYIFDIKSPALCVCMSSIFICFPAIACAMVFSYTIHYYAIAVLFVLVGVLLLSRFPHKPVYFMLSSLCFSFSLGIYQAYYTFAAGLLILFLIHECLQKDSDWKSVLSHAFYKLFSLISGYILYSILLNICLHFFHAQLADYKGINQMGHLTVGSLPSLLLQIYYNYIGLPLHDYLSVCATGILRVFILCLFILVICLLFFWKESSILKKAELCAFILILPLAANIMSLLTESNSIYTLMALGLITVFFLPAILVNNLNFKVPGKKTFFHTVLCCILLLSALNYIWQNNGNYRSLYYTNRKLENYYSDMFTRIRSTEGYQKDMSILFVGHTITDPAFYELWYNTPFQYVGCSIPLNSYYMSRQRYIENYLGFLYYEASPDQIEMYSDTITQMNTYPDDGSIRIADDGTILVRFE